MDASDEFDFWLGEYFENVKAQEEETWRLLKDMCRRGNEQALAFLRITFAAGTRGLTRAAARSSPFLTPCAAPRSETRFWQPYVGASP